MGTNVVPATLATPTPKGEDGLFTSAVFDKNTGEYIVKVINTTDKAQTVDIKFDGLKKIEGNATTVTLDCSDYTLDNTLDSSERHHSAGRMGSSRRQRHQNYRSR